MKNRRSFRSAFSLIEVVLALGVVTFGLVTLMALFSSSLQSAKEVVNQDESFGVARALPSFLQARTFGVVYADIKAGTDPGIYAFANPQNGGAEMTVAIKNDLVLDDVDKRAGRLFRVVLALSSNTAIRPAVTAPDTFVKAPKVSDLPPVANNYGDAMLPLSVKVYVVPQLDASVSQAKPVLFYDTVITR